jgi:hypothetical protein
MPVTLNLPGHEVFVSNVEVIGTRLSIRLVSDYHPGADPAVYLVSFDHPVSSESAVEFLGQCKDESIYVYVAHDSEGVFFDTESGNRHLVKAVTITSTPTTFNEVELIEIARRVYAWYLSENKALRSAQQRIEAARSLLVEFARRTEIKASSHGANSTVTTLYSQQQELIRRVLDALRT